MDAAQHVAVVVRQSHESRKIDWYDVSRDSQPETHKDTLCRFSLSFMSYVYCTCVLRGLSGPGCSTSTKKRGGQKHDYKTTFFCLGYSASRVEGEERIKLKREGSDRGNNKVERENTVREKLKEGEGER